jgi:hypothetical protein
VFIATTGVLVEKAGTATFAGALQIGAATSNETDVGVSGWPTALAMSLVSETV